MRQLPKFSTALTVAALLGATALIAVLFITLRRDAAVRSQNESASDRIFRSALLPDSGWRTYGSDVWSVGYPADWSVVERTEQIGREVQFIPPEERLDSGETFFTIREELRTRATVESVYSAPGFSKSEFLFAGYPAIKYTQAGGREEYFLFYNSRIFALTTDNPKDEQVGIMLATFQYLN